jgi:hypothetical protein
MRLRTVLLKHTLSDGSWHYDWLIERAAGAGAAESAFAGEPDPRVLMSFRTMVRVDEATTPFEAVRVEDHRRSYLDYEGPISGGRGEVVRVAAGATAGFDEADSARPRVVVRFDGGAARAVGQVVEWVGRAVEGERWRFERGDSS